MYQKILCYYCSQNYSLSKAGSTDILSLNITDNGPAIVNIELWLLHLGLVCSFLATCMLGPNNMRAATSLQIGIQIRKSRK